MAEKQPSELKKAAAKAQAFADTTGQNKEEAKLLQSVADHSEAKKHGE